jgi:hypothetical protein
MFDAYVRRGRFYPAVVAAAPAFALAAILVSWDSLGLPHVIAAGAATVLVVVMSDVARRRGRAIEPGIIRRMGGLPSITMMRYRDDTFDKTAKSAMHKFVGGKIAASEPTPQSEQADPAAADAFYKQCGDWLRENTRDAKRFKILFDENVTYGFHRNLLGLKRPALALDAAILLFCLIMLWLRFPLKVADAPTQKLLFVVAIALLHGVYMLLFVNETGVVEAGSTADNYCFVRKRSRPARQLNAPRSGKSGDPMSKFGIYDIL